MKKLITIAALSIITSCSWAQTNNTFFQSVEYYFTSFNTNYTFKGTKIEADTGYAQVTGVNAASKVNLQYDINDSFELGTSLQFSGIGSAINAWEGQVGYAVVNYYDTKVEGILRGGYDDITGGGVIEPGITLKKKLTPNTYAETAITFPIYTKSKFTRTPTFYIGAGFTF